MSLDRVRMLLALMSICYHWDGARAGAMLFNSNAIKTLPGGGVAAPVSASPDFILYDSGSKNQAIDSPQVHYSCLDDDDCAHDEFCYGSRFGAQVCLTCRKRRKRCLRDAMCCLGNYCSNGICMSSEPEETSHTEIEETVIENLGHEDHHGTIDIHSGRTTLPSRPHSIKGEEGDVCLRSSDCAAGLCCARHFWSKICKPVLKEGQVCTKHKKKGSHGLEIFQRCDCGDGLLCRIQKGDHSGNKSSRLHTCQRH
ncbi:dickkopf-related protein 1b isoform X1 [Latimeria chalumnae]|uniref:dickkopf-related protein 1b isoform X1 n=1 Tax=Latimeria chalumnae TaxID=7897 RepID=UPI0003C15561|nr:PREDICTED: dickkopf-related protein 1 isoform X1 [Latimeria chalumnae]|eukprot:XP_006007709.1 PREDICTED: dickkopf-related protein 1 isoform X1 [Latimeria chalumnae]